MEASVPTRQGLPARLKFSSVLAQGGAFQVLRNQCRARGDAEFVKYAPEVRAYGPGADLQHIGDGLVRITFSDQSGDLAFTRTQARPRAGAGNSGGWLFDQPAAHAVYFNVEKNEFIAAGSAAVVPTVLMGFGLPSDPIHGPDEKFYLPNFYRGIDASVWFLAAAGRLLRPDPP